MIVTDIGADTAFESLQLDATNLTRTTHLRLGAEALNLIGN